MAAKDFGPIESDYDFFMSHATEAESDVAHYVQELAGFAEDRAAIRLLDFGCGAGEFSQRFLTAMNWSPSTLQIALVEPVAAQRAQAAERVAPFSRQGVMTLQRLTPEEGTRFDLILANHVLYYVDDLEATLAQLVASLAPGGKLLLAIAGWDNVLLKFWQVGFALLGRPVPYFAAEDVAASLSRRSLPFHQTQAPYQLRFADSPDNRLKILRFLFADYLKQLPAERLLREFDPYTRQGFIEIDTQSQHFLVSG